MTWLFNGDAYFAKNVKFGDEENGTLLIVNTKKENSGVYSCITKDGDNKEYRLNSEVLVVGKIL